jgi:scyllo-inositol 2-dehydrogenase (NADP+)
VRQLRVGIAGFGRIGNEHAGWLAQCASLVPVAVFDPTPERRSKAERLGLSGFDSLDALLAADVDIVLVSTPTAMHCEQAKAALTAGKHVMVEKPMALDFSQSKELVDTADSNSKVLSVFHNRRWDIDYLTVKNAIASSQLGRVFNIESRLGQWGSCVGPAAREWRPGWRNEAAFGGGGLYDWGSHFVDQIWRLLLPAKPVRVFAQLRGNVWTKDCDDFARVCIDFDSGCTAMVEINTTTTQPLPRWHIDGTLGSATSPFSLDFDTCKWAELTFTPASGEVSRLLSTAEPGLNEIQIWDQFAAAVRGESLPAVTAQSVLSTMALLDAARESAASGTLIQISDSTMNHH